MQSNLRMKRVMRQSSYLSKISQIIFVEKKLSCGEILGKYGKFWEILPQFTRAFTWRKIEPKKYICGEKMTNMRSVMRTVLAVSRVIVSVRATRML